MPTEDCTINIIDAKKTAEKNRPPQVLAQRGISPITPIGTTGSKGREAESSPTADAATATAAANGLEPPALKPLMSSWTHGCCCLAGAHGLDDRHSTALQIHAAMPQPHLLCAA
jgi:hypothetical protein